ncbi:hypothetical protein AM587_10017736 [Phytophthora nicotianae]|uniref:Uncharacterized protein n=1 Tax=Phytophthora nicotianae TaxID=4792 RepID=A0A0W8AZ36_PHYNI|nr:hypothetical protein AM587_10017736 [Phytophthora nicotianae]
MRTQLRSDIVSLAEDMRRKVKETIAEDCKYYSFTSDIWTARNARSYIAFTIHYVDENLKFINWTLGVLEIPGKHDGPAIAAALENIVFVGSNETYGSSKTSNS